jgi:hypothetical protein
MVQAEEEEEGSAPEGDGGDDRSDQADTFEEEDTMSVIEDEVLEQDQIGT